MRKIIGLLGAKGAGKDTCAQYLVQEAGFVRVGFADALYAEVATAFGVTVEFLGNRDTKETPLPQLALAHCANADFVEVALGVLSGGSVLTQAEELALLEAPRSPRQIMQLWGTEYRRKSRFGVDSYWLDQVRALTDSYPDSSFVVTDVRFKNEARFVTEVSGLLVRIRRPELEEREAADRARSGTAAHPSETELLGYPVDAEVLNVEGNPDSLREGIFALVTPVLPA